MLQTTPKLREIWSSQSLRSEGNDQSKPFGKDIKEQSWQGGALELIAPGEKWSARSNPWSPCWFVRALQCSYFSRYATEHVHSFARYTLPLNVTRLKFGREKLMETVKIVKMQMRTENRSRLHWYMHCHTSFLDPIAVAATSELCQYAKSLLQPSRWMLDLHSVQKRIGPTMDWMSYNGWFVWRRWPQTSKNHDTIVPIWHV